MIAESELGCNSRRLRSTRCTRSWQAGWRGTITGLSVHTAASRLPCLPRARVEGSSRSALKGTVPRISNNGWTEGREQGLDRRASIDERSDRKEGMPERVDGRLMPPSCHHRESMPSSCISSVARTGRFVFGGAVASLQRHQPKTSRISKSRGITAQGRFRREGPVRVIRSGKRTSLTGASRARQSPSVSGPVGRSYGFGRRRLS